MWCCQVYRIWSYFVIPYNEQHVSWGNILTRALWVIVKLLIRLLLCVERWNM